MSELLVINRQVIHDNYKYYFLQLDCPVFYHFIGSGAGSTDPFALATRLYKWLKRCITTEEQGELMLDLSAECRVYNF